MKYDWLHKVKLWANRKTFDPIYRYEKLIFIGVIYIFITSITTISTLF